MATLPKLISSALIPLTVMIFATDAQALSSCPSAVSDRYGEWIEHITNVVIPLNAANGSVIGSTTYSLDYNCPANIAGTGGFRFEAHSLGGIWQTTPYPGVITNISTSTSTDLTRSIGFRITNLETGKVITGLINNFVEWGPPTSSRPTRGSLKIKIELIKLNDLIYNVKKAYAGYRLFVIRSVNNGIASMPTIGGDGVYVWSIVPYINATFKEMQQSCVVANRSVAVPLAPVAAAKLSAVGMTAGDKGFDIGLSCQPGTNVYVTLTDMTDQGNTGNQLTLTADSTAKGVKLRILKDGQPVGYGPDSAEIGNLNQWHVGPSATTTNIPLSAQYIATGPVSPGTVKGVATFTMSYQ